MANLVVIGSCSVDLVVEAKRRPKAGETLMADRFFVTCGGKGANQAVAAARLGAEVHMIGAVGDDSYGELSLRNLTANGVDAAQVEVLADTPTGTAHITLAEGDNSILVAMGANARLTATHVEKSLHVLGRPDLVLLQNETPRAVLEFTIRHCAANGVPVLWNPAPALKLDDDVMKLCRYITPNEHEFGVLFPQTDPAELRAEWREKLIVTRGSKGADYYTPEGLKRVPAYTVEPVDTTGAGDTFNGAFAVATAEGRDTASAIAFANAAAALSTTVHGAQGGMPTRERLEEWWQCRKQVF